MEWVAFLLLFLGFHCVLYFLDSLFRSCHHLPYLWVAHRLGIHVGFLQVRLTTSALNRLFHKWGGMVRPRLLRLWFSAGVWATLLLLLPGTILLVFTAFEHFSRMVASGGGAGGGGSPGAVQRPVLEPVLPGVNLPSSQWGHYLLALLTCSVVHEAGHALAAVREGVPVMGCGVMILAVLPAAFVELSSEALRALPPKRRLRVLCAGVWHNMVLAGAAYGAILCLPSMLSPLFHHGRGILLYGLDVSSGAGGPTGLQVGDHILRVDQCIVQSGVDWRRCLSTSAFSPPNAYCVPAEMVHQLDESVPVRQLPRGSVECCGASSPNHLCFEHLEGGGGAMALPQYSCLPARNVLDSALGLCGVPKAGKATSKRGRDEEEGAEGDEGAGCMRDSFCLRPSLDNSTRLVQVRVRGRADVLYLGSPHQMAAATLVSDYVPRSGPADGVEGEDSQGSPWPESVETFLCYVLAFSLALALLNAVPCLALDGQHLTQALLEMSVLPAKRALAANALVGVGTFLVALNLVLGLASLIST